MVMKGSPVQIRSLAPKCVDIAQLGERYTGSVEARGSNPLISTICFSKSGGVPEWLKGADCKSAGEAYEGSNPSPSTISGNSSVVEHHVANVRVAGSNPVSRSKLRHLLGCFFYV